MSAPRWWIEAEGRSWGPYPAERLAAFQDEGRFGAASLVSQAENGPFAPAALEPGLQALFGSEPPEAPVAPQVRTLLVFADAGDGAAMFEASLGGHGEAVRVRPGLWLVRARETAAALRNALSRRLRAGEALLVVEAELADAAWFNLDGDTDRALRKVWAQP